MIKSSVLALSCLLCACLAQADTNVALNKAVTLSGTGFGLGWGGNLAAAGTVTDGIFLGNGHTWDNDTVYWSGTDAIVQIDLGASFSIVSLKVEADNNDTYQVDYRIGDTWQPAALVPAAYNGGGLQLRTIHLDTPVATNGLRIYSTGGDGLYSVSEFQAFAAPVPEPETYALLLAGLGLVAAVARRRAG